MKKMLFSFAVCIGLLISACAYAENIRVSVSDAENDIADIVVDLSDEYIGENVGLYVFNPGKTETDMMSDPVENQKVLQYFSQCRYNGETLKFSFKVNFENVSPQNEKLFKIKLVTRKNQSRLADSAEKEFYFYSYAEKQQLAAQINSAAADTDALADKIYKTFTVSDFDIYDTCDKTKVAERLLDTVKNGKITVTCGNAEELFKKAAITEAFNSGNENVVKNGELLYAGIIGLSSDFVSVYGDINKKGRETVLKNMFSRPYSDISQVKSALEDEILTAVIYYNNVSGYGHIETVMSKYGKYYAQKGLDLDSYNSCLKSSVGRSVIANGPLSLEKMTEYINGITKPQQSGGGGSSGGSSSGGGGVSAGSGIVPSGKTAQGSSAAEQEVTFSDIGGVPWAQESIRQLYRRNIINGRARGEFAPAEYITREEFTKMAVLAFKLSKNTEPTEFADVAGDRWSYSYIMTACAASVVKGENGKFYPDNSITRRDAAVIIARALISCGCELSATGEKSGFGDENSIPGYARESVGILKNAGIINGDENGLFNPNTYISRAETAKLIYSAVSASER